MLSQLAYIIELLKIPLKGIYLGIVSNSVSNIKPI